MATIEFINRKNQTKNAMRRVLKYITRSDKTTENLTYSIFCDKDTAYEDFIQVKQLFGKENGRLYIHFIQSFSPDENITPDIANEIAQRLLSHPVFNGFQIVMATHTDTPHLHTHFVINTVNVETGRKWHVSSKDLQSLKDYSDDLCKEYGLSVIDNEKKTKGHKSSGEYRSQKRGESWKYELFLAVTSCMRIAVNRKDFIEKMNVLGYQVIWSDNRTYVTFITPDCKKCRNRKLYPPERFTKENMEQCFEHNKHYLNEKSRQQKWDFLMSALYLFHTSPQNGANPKYPLVCLEGDALKEYLLIHDNKGEIDWSDDKAEEDFEL